MAKGKHAVAAAKRRENEALDRVAVLEDELAQEQALRKKQSKELETEIQKLRGRIVAGFDDELDRRAEKLRERYAAKLKGEREGFERRLRDAFSFLGEHGELLLPMDGYARFAELLGVKVGDVMNWTTSTSRRSRRSSNRDVRALASDEGMTSWRDEVAKRTG